MKHEHDGWHNGGGAKRALIMWRSFCFVNDSVSSKATVPPALAFTAVFIVFPSYVTLQNGTNTSSAPHQRTLSSSFLRSNPMPPSLPCSPDERVGLVQHAPACLEALDPEDTDVHVPAHVPCPAYQVGRRGWNTSDVFENLLMRHEQRAPLEIPILVYLH